MANWAQDLKDLERITRYAVGQTTGHWTGEFANKDEAAATPEAAPAAEADPLTYLPNIETGETSAAYTLRARKVNKSMLSAADTLL